MPDLDSPSHDARDFELTTAQFQRIADLLRRETGISLSARKADLVYTRLAKRLRQLGLPSFSAYLALLDGPHGAEELPFLVNRLTTNLTRFFRESHHFDDLSRHVTTRIAAGATRLRIWSAGCSTGQEPYSAAAAALEAIGARPCDLKILATDIDTEVLSKAAVGRYRADELEEAPPCLVKRFRRSGAEAEAGEELRRVISFKRLNLIGPWPMKGPFDAIFCRNVVIYFDPPTQDEIFARMSRLLTPGGRLYLGHAETLRAPGELASLGATTYVRRIEEEAAA